MSAVGHCIPGRSWSNSDLAGPICLRVKSPMRISSEALVETCLALKSTVETRTSWTEANVFCTCMSYGC